MDTVPKTEIIFEEITEGIIWWIPEGTIGPNIPLLTEINDLLYNESIGLIGLTAGGWITSRGHLDVNAKNINYVSGCFVFRSELHHYGIRWSD